MPRSTDEQRPRRARDGDRAALEALVESVRNPIYNLAVRMLWHPEDAEDACQEILIRIITNLASFRGESAFSTWAYRVAANYLLSARARRRVKTLSFDEFAADLAEGREIAGEYEAPSHAEGERLLEEVKLGCMTGMLSCLDADHRIAYILAEIFELPGDEAAAVLDITPSALRKRLSRARQRLHGFLEAQCGHASSRAACRCEKALPGAIARRRVVPEQPLFALRRKQAARVEALERTREAVQLYRNHPQYESKSDAVKFVRQLLDRDDLRFALDGRQKPADQ